MLKNWTFPAERKFLPQMLTEIEGEISKYISNNIWLNRLKLCSEEILVNIIDYSGSKTLGFSFEFLENENALRFEFIDEGTPYNPLENDNEVDIEAEMDERSIGGLGIFLYTTIMDKMAYRYENGKNILTAIKNLGEAVN
ncbi:MAG: ATP-binding protein [Selenomonadaceae bacterium]|nr:ATP-binding protein [Selenomonadaceae bacterium]